MAGGGPLRARRPALARPLPGVRGSAISGGVPERPVHRLRASARSPAVAGGGRHRGRGRAGGGDRYRGSVAGGRDRGPHRVGRGCGGAHLRRPGGPPAARPADPAGGGLGPGLAGAGRGRGGRGGVAAGLDRGGRVRPRFRADLAGARGPRLRPGRRQAGGQHGSPARMVGLGGGAGRAVPGVLSQRGGGAGAPAGPAGAVARLRALRPVPGRGHVRRRGLGEPLRRGPGGAGIATAYLLATVTGVSTVPGVKRVVALGLLLARRVRWRDSLPFGPFLVGGTFAAVVWASLSGEVPVATA